MPTAITHPDQLRALAQFRFELRQFMQASEQAVEQKGLHPQQHQLLLQVCGAAEGVSVSIAYVAERLGLRHNSAVELVDRCVKEDLIVRAPDPGDGRRALLSVTAKGQRLLADLSDFHAAELQERGTALIAALMQVQATGSESAGVAARRPRSRQ
jgi:DNA-binding MarR family transcriptional regulator